LIRRRCPPGRAVHHPFSIDRIRKCNLGAPDAADHMIGGATERTQMEKAEVAGRAGERARRRRGTAKMDTPTDLLKGRRNRATPRRSTGVRNNTTRGIHTAHPPASAHSGEPRGSATLAMPYRCLYCITGEFIDKVRDSHGKAIVIDRLWSIKFGYGGNADAQFPQAASERSQPVGHLALLFAFPFSRQDGIPGQGRAHGRRLHRS